MLKSDNIKSSKVNSTQSILFSVVPKINRNFSAMEFLDKYRQKSLSSTNTGIPKVRLYVTIILSYILIGC